jgi:hypothetical protein
MKKLTRGLEAHAPPCFPHIERSSLHRLQIMTASTSRDCSNAAQTSLTNSHATLHHFISHRNRSDRARKYSAAFLRHVKSIVQTSALIINTVYRSKLGRSFRLSTRSGIPRIFQLTKKSSASAKTKPLGRTPQRSTDLSMTARSGDDHSTQCIPHKFLVAFALYCSIRRRTPRPLTCFEQSILTSISKIAIQVKEADHYQVHKSRHYGGPCPSHRSLFMLQ